MIRLQIIQNIIIFKQKPDTSINQSEGVAIGAAILNNKIELLLLDVIPLSLRIETKYCLFNKIINRNSKIVIIKINVFIIDDNNQKSSNL